MKHLKLAAALCIFFCLSCGVCLAETYRWADEKSEQPVLFDSSGKQVGNFFKAENVFKPLDASGQFGKASALPQGASLPEGVKFVPTSKCNCGEKASCGGNCEDCRCLTNPKEVENYGVDTSKIHTSDIKLNGKCVSKKKALELIEKGLPDDANKLRLTVIGSNAMRAKVLSELNANPAWATLKDKFSVQDYGPDSWAVSAFEKRFDPTIYVQSPPDAKGFGQVLHRQEDFEGGSDKLIKALRKADPLYDPAKDPDLRKDPVAPTPASPSSPNSDEVMKWLGSLPSWAWILGGVALLFFLKGSSPSPSSSPR